LFPAGGKLSKLAFTAWPLFIVTDGLFTSMMAFLTTDCSIMCLQLLSSCSCSEIEQAEAAVSVNEKEWFCPLVLQPV
jgi:hypothetical protein